MSLHSSRSLRYSAPPDTAPTPFDGAVVLDLLLLNPYEAAPSPISSRSLRFSPSSSSSKGLEKSSASSSAAAAGLGGTEEAEATETAEGEK